MTAQPSAVGAASTDTAAEPLLEARGLTAGYGPVAVIRDIDLQVKRGQVVALLGPNGAGKTTTVLALAGELKPMRGGVYSSGRKTAAPLFKRARGGLAYVGEERSVFMTMTVMDNLRVSRTEPDFAFSLFPPLKKLAKRRVGLLSGGEQQMLALARALGRRPSVLLADELSLGLAPIIVDHLLATVREVADSQGLGVLLVEQHIERALACADYVYVLRRGELVMQGEAADMRGRAAELQDSYLQAAER